MSAGRVWMAGVAGILAAMTGGAMLAGGGPAVAGVRPGLAVGDISTVAGGIGGPAKATAVSINVSSVSFAGGQVYVSGYGAVRDVNPATDRLTTPAGSGVAGPLVEGGSAANASMEADGGTADHSGNLLIADVLNQRIRVAAARTGTFYGQAMTAGHIYTVAGDGVTGFSGDGGLATGAALNFPEAVAVDGAGNVVIADSANERVRVVAARTGTFYGQAMTGGHIYTVAGDGTLGFSGDGGPATSATVANPSGIAVDGAGNLVISDTGNERVRVVAVATGTFYGRPMTAGDIYTVAGGGSGGLGNGGPATRAKLHDPSAATLDGAGNLLIADTENAEVRVVAARTGTFYGRSMTAGDIYAVAGNGLRGFSGDGGPATQARLATPSGVAVDASGDILIAVAGSLRVRLVAAHTGTFYGRPMTAGDIYTVAGTGARFGYSGDGAAATGAELAGPAGVTLASGNSVLIADTLNDRVRIVAGTTGTLYGRAMTAGDIYTVAGNGHFGFSGDDGPATSAALDAPDQVTVDGAGNLVIADTGNSRIRVVAAATGSFYGRAMTAGDIYTVAGNGQFGYSGDGGPATSAALDNADQVTADGAGNLVIADTGNNRLRVVAVATGSFYGRAMTAGDIYTVAGNGSSGYSGDGGPATGAMLDAPRGVTLDAAGNLVIADTGNSRVRVVAVATGSFYGQAMTAGDIYTVAGSGSSGFSGDGGPATSAMLDAPDGPALDAAGNLLIADTGNNRVRVVAAATGTFYGQAMTAGHIYTVAGDGTAGFTGDGRLATRAGLDGPEAVAVAGPGDLLIADTGSDRIREVAG